MTDDTEQRLDASYAAYLKKAQKLERKFTKERNTLLKVFQNERAKILKPTPAKRRFTDGHGNDIGHLVEP